MRSRWEWWIEDLIARAVDLAGGYPNVTLTVRRCVPSFDCDTCEEGIDLREWDVTEEDLETFARQHAECGAADIREDAVGYDEGGAP